MKPISLLNEKRFVVFFNTNEEYNEPEGFYAEYQPHYHWNFTSDLNKAKKYKTVEAASKRAVYGERNGLVYEIDSTGLKNTTPIPLADIRPKRIKDVEKNALYTLILAEKSNMNTLLKSRNI